MSLRDIKIPADPSDAQTTDARSALPPVDFHITSGVNSNVISIVDRQAVANRSSTASYRVYHLSAGFLPSTDGVTAARRLAGKNVANLVAEISAPGRGTTLIATDQTYYQQAGHYYCVAVNRSGVEAPPEHVLSTDGIIGGAAPSISSVTGGGGGGGGPTIYVIDIDGYHGSLHLVAGTNMTITQSGGDTFTFDASGGGGGFTMQNSSTTVDGIAVTFTFTTTVSANDMIFADGRLMDEAAGDYTRSTNTVTFAFAPISTVKRVF